MGSTLRFPSLLQHGGEEQASVTLSSAPHATRVFCTVGCSARIGAPPSRCYDVDRRADAATRLNNPKASHSQALSPHCEGAPPAPHLRNFTPGAPLLPETSRPPIPGPHRSKDPSKDPPWTPREGEEGTKSKLEGGGGEEGRGGFAIFFTEENCKAIC